MATNRFLDKSGVSILYSNLRKIIEKSGIQNVKDGTVKGSFRSINSFPESEIYKLGEGSVSLGVANKTGITVEELEANGFFYDPTISWENILLNDGFPQDKLNEMKSNNSLMFELTENESSGSMWYAYLSFAMSQQGGSLEAEIEAAEEELKAGGLQPEEEANLRTILILYKAVLNCKYHILTEADKEELNSLIDESLGFITGKKIRKYFEDKINSEEYLLKTISFFKIMNDPTKPDGSPYTVEEFKQELLKDLEKYNQAVTEDPQVAAQLDYMKSIFTSKISTFIKSIGKFNSDGTKAVGKNAIAGGANQSVNAPFEVDPQNPKDAFETGLLNFLKDVGELQGEPLPPEAESMAGMLTNMLLPNSQFPRISFPSLVDTSGSIQAAVTALAEMEPDRLKGYPPFISGPIEECPFLSEILSLHPELSADFQNHPEYGFILRTKIYVPAAEGLAMQTGNYLRPDSSYVLNFYETYAVPSLNETGGAPLVKKEMPNFGTAEEPRNSIEFNVIKNLSLPAGQGLFNSVENRDFGSIDSNPNNFFSLSIINKDITEDLKKITNPNNETLDDYNAARDPQEYTLLHTAFLYPEEINASFNSEASGEGSFAYGERAVASGKSSTAIGSQTIANSYGQFVFGRLNEPDVKATDKASSMWPNNVEIVGWGDVDRKNIRTLDRKGNMWVRGDIKMGGNNFAEGKSLLAVPPLSEAADVGSTLAIKTINYDGTYDVEWADAPNPAMAEGSGYNSAEMSGANASSSYAAAFNQANANGSAAAAFGNNNVYVDGSYSIGAGDDVRIYSDTSTNMNNTGAYSFGMGRGIRVSGQMALGFGASNNVSGFISAAIGASNTVSGQKTFVEGANNKVTGGYSHVEGYNNTHDGEYCHVEGAGNVVESSVFHSHVEGSGNIVKGSDQHVFGTYNEPSTDLMEIVGNGNYNGGHPIRKNARTLDKYGNEVVAGTITAAGFQTADGSPIGGAIAITDQELDEIINNKGVITVGE